ncbi:hypothetical protein VPH35_059931 [Triticum aestivum]
MGGESRGGATVDLQRRLSVLSCSARCCNVASSALPVLPCKWLVLQWSFTDDCRCYDAALAGDPELRCSAQCCNGARFPAASSAPMERCRAGVGAAMKTLWSAVGGALLRCRRGGGVWLLLRAGWRSFPRRGTSSAPVLLQ